MTKLSKDGSLNYTDEQINTATHMAGAIFALFGSMLLIIKSAQAEKWWHVVSFTVYGFTLVALFTMSALHHGVTGTEKTNRRLRTLDYVAVYGLITGSLVPLCLVLFRGVLGYTVLVVALMVTAFGVTMRSVYYTLPAYISLTLYLCLGWLPVFLVLLDRSILSIGGLLLFIAGGLFYTLGSIVYAREKPNPVKEKFGFHEIWHIAVLLGALCHFLFMYRYVLPVK